MTDYTRRQRDAINRAWSWLIETASCTDWSMERRLKDALKAETRERSSVHVAKALLMRSFEEGRLGHQLHRPDHPLSLADIYSFAAGCQVAMICGAGMADRWPENLGPDAYWHEWFAAADAAHREAIKASLDAIDKQR